MSERRRLLFLGAPLSSTIAHRRLGIDSAAIFSSAAPAHNRWGALFCACAADDSFKRILLPISGDQQNHADDGAGGARDRYGDDVEIEIELRAKERQHDQKPDQDNETVRLEPR